MPNWKQMTKEETTSGPGRLGWTDTVIATGSQPDEIADIIDSVTWEFEAPFNDIGGTDGGVNIVKGYSETEYSADQSDGPYAVEPTGNTVTINTNIIQVGDLEKVAMAWALSDPITLNGAGERRLNIAAVREVPERSIAIAEVQRGTDLLRTFFLGRVSNVAGDVAYNMAPTGQRAMPLNLRAFADYSFGFGYIIEEDGFGGILNP
jgi:hypothetical protein